MHCSEVNPENFVWDGGVGGGKWGIDTQCTKRTRNMLFLQGEGAWGHASQLEVFENR